MCSALGEIIQPCQELCDLLLGNLGEHLRKVVDKHMGDVVVAGMQAAEEALEEIVRAHRVGVVAGVDQARLIRNIVGEFFILFNAHDRTGFLTDGRGDISTRRFVLPEPLRPMISWTICQSHSF